MGESKQRGRSKRITGVKNLAISIAFVGWTHDTRKRVRGDINLEHAFS